ncbi:MAG TPA: glycosyltransferase, partial [Candidatus Paceibacterota bacterium]
MRIGFFSETSLPLRYGIETSMASFGSKLEELGHKVYVYTSSAPGYKEINRRIFRLRAFAGGKKTDMRFAVPIGENGRLKDFIKNKLDIAHLHTVLTLGLLGKYIAWRQKIPTVYTHHNDYKGAIQAYLGKRSIIAYLVDKLAIWFANTSTAVIAPSEKMREILLSSGVKRPIHILPTGVDLKFFAVTTKTKNKALAIRKQYNISPRT